jgi:hypothetical protein
MARMIALSAALLLSGFGIVSHAQSPSSLSLKQVLANPNIWGKDLSTALADASAMHKAGETQVAIFPDKVQTTTGTQIEQAEVHLATVQHFLSSISKSEKAEYHKALNCNTATSKAMCLSPLPGSQHFEKIEENNGVTVAATSPRLQFLKPGTNIDTIQAQLGKPERVSQQVIQTKYERRPIILTKYQYASGAVEFATSNLKPNGKLDRVFLNTEAVSQVLKEHSN